MAFIVELPPCKGFPTIFVIVQNGSLCDYDGDTFSNGDSTSSSITSDLRVQKVQEGTLQGTYNLNLFFFKLPSTDKWSDGMYKSDSRAISLAIFIIFIGNQASLLPFAEFSYSNLYTQPQGRLHSLAKFGFNPSYCINFTWLSTPQSLQFKKVCNFFNVCSRYPAYPAAWPSWPRFFCEGECAWQQLQQNFPHPFLLTDSHRHRDSHSASSRVRIGRRRRANDRSKSGGL